MARQGNPVLDLSPASVGSHITGFRNVGGWGGEEGGELDRAIDGDDDQDGKAASPMGSKPLWLLGCLWHAQWLVDRAGCEAALEKACAEAGVRPRLHTVRQTRLANRRAKSVLLQNLLTVCHLAR